ncbi:unnamed protein product [Macrosiphum euphorbiae]|uniref:Secreted protein n=1 Tax=Macrosiphum euphorbiae TaxID=13131 RepID=A0AAV0VS32_9HEMI|nr:unnamed protein product [Macrosiphum euphorbiae]
MRRRLASVLRSKWLRCAMAAVALNYAAECVARNEPYWETDVAYLHWSTDVPAVTVCPAASGPPADHLRPPRLVRSVVWGDTKSALAIKWGDRLNSK